MGVDGWWPDDGDNLPIEARLARHRLYYEGSLKDRPNVRPWSLNRNGYAGAARYGAWIWSGDVQSRWVTLANHIPVGLNFSLSVSPFWGSDTGGFFLAPRNEYTGELYVRWFQFSAFNPLFRSHGRNWHLHLPWGWNTGPDRPARSRGERGRVSAGVGAAQRGGRAGLQTVPRAAIPDAAVQLHDRPRGVRHRDAADAGAAAALPG